MKTDGLEELTIKDLKYVFSINSLSFKKALHAMQEFRDHFGLTDRQALNASAIATKLFDDK